MDYLLKNLKLFAGTANGSLENSAIWINGNRVRFAGKAAEIPKLPKDTIEKDLEGKFVMPGMTETHAHLSFADASPFAIGETLVEEATLTAAGDRS